MLQCTFRLPDGVRPGDRVVIELTACGEVARMSTLGAATSRGTATGGAERGQGRGRGSWGAGQEALPMLRCPGSPGFP